MRLDRRDSTAHAADVRRHVRRLSEKSYAAQFESAPEFVVMFIPGEALLYAAMEKDPELTDFGATQNVILATPTTLIALLRAVATGWRQEQVARNAREIQALGRELHDRLQTVVAHLSRLGDRMGGAVDAYNAAISSFESRVLVSARKFRELGSGGEAELEELGTTEQGRTPARHSCAGPRPPRRRLNASADRAIPFKLSSRRPDETSDTSRDGTRWTCV